MTQSQVAMSAASCVRFRQIRETEAEDSIVIERHGPYCAADLGRKSNGGHNQRLMLGANCLQKGHGVVLHELMHILGVGQKKHRKFHRK